MTAAWMASMKALSLFSGIGGLDLAAHAAGIETAAFCEIEPFAVQVLERRWPGVPIIDDVRKIRGCDWSVDVVHGGFPCQDLSVAGKQAGLEGARSGLWFEMLRVISEIRPSFVLAENVRGAVNLALPAVQSGLEGEGYEVRASVVPASAFGAPHQRERLFVLGVRKDVANSACERLQGLWTTREQESEIHAGEIVPVCDSVRDGKLWPTPQHRDYRKGMPISINDQVGKGSLNPAWVEILMGFPIGWTDPDCDEPEPWPGWPAPMNATQNWPTTRGCDGIVRHSQNWMHKRVTENRDVDITTAVKTNVKTGQYPYEPPRTVTKCADRAKRLKCLGNAVVPQQAYPLFEAIAQIHNLTT